MLSQRQDVLCNKISYPRIINVNKPKGKKNPGVTSKTYFKYLSIKQGYRKTTVGPDLCLMWWNVNSDFSDIFSKKSYIN